MNRIALLLAAAVAPALALPEVATMDEAKAAAQAAGCNIFVDFTGTDWCTACIHLRTKIVESPEFEAALGKKFVLVPVDFPALLNLWLPFPMRLSASARLCLPPSKSRVCPVWC